jgi:hypothetical protein
VIVDERLDTEAHVVAPIHILLQHSHLLFLLLLTESVFHSVGEREEELSEFIHP